MIIELIVDNMLRKVTLLCVPNFGLLTNFKVNMQTMAVALAYTGIQITSSTQKWRAWKKVTNLALLNLTEVLMEPKEASNRWVGCFLFSYFYSIAENWC